MFAGDVEWFRPLYRRVILIILCLGWVAFELIMQGDDFWLMVSVLATVYAVWVSLRAHQAAKNTESD